MTATPESGAVGANYDPTRDPRLFTEADLAELKALGKPMTWSEETGTWHKEIVPRQPHASPLASEQNGKPTATSVRSLGNGVSVTLTTRTSRTADIQGIDTTAPGVGAAYTERAMRFLQGLEDPHNTQEWWGDPDQTVYSQSGHKSNGYPYGDAGDVEERAPLHGEVVGKNTAAMVVQAALAEQATQRRSRAPISNETPRNRAGKRLGLAAVCSLLILGPPIGMHFFTQDNLSLVRSVATDVPSGAQMSLQFVLDHTPWSQRGN